MARRKPAKREKKKASADMQNGVNGDAEKKIAKPAASKHFYWKLLVAIALVGALLALCVYPLGADEEDAAEMERMARRKEDDVLAAENSIDAETPPLRVYDHFAVLEVVPHDPEAFTQGLTYGNNKLWEGTGMYGRSEIRHLDPTTGNVFMSSPPLAQKYFGEGISYYEHPKEKRLIQLSWKEKTGWIYNCDTFELDTEFTYDTSTGEGWGITYHAERNEFIVTDGSEHLHFWDAETLQEKTEKRLTVRYTNPADGSVHPVRHLNEVEWVDGYLLSNVWYQDVLIKINIDTGMVEKVYNFKELYVDRAPDADCFNGISVTDKPGELWVTGKQWPHMYRVKLLI